MRAVAGADAALRAVCVDPDSRVPERRVVLAPVPGVSEWRELLNGPVPRACAGARACRPRSTAKRSRRCASPGWWRTAGGAAEPLRRRYWELVGARGRNVVVFHDLCSGGWFVQGS